MEFFKNMPRRYTYGGRYTFGAHCMEILNPFDEVDVLPWLNKLSMSLSLMSLRREHLRDEGVGC